MISWISYFVWKLVLQMSFLLELSQSSNDWLFRMSGDLSKPWKFSVFFSLAQASVMIMHMARHFWLWTAIKSIFVCTLLLRCLSAVMHSLVWPEFIVWRSVCRVKSTTYFWKRNFNVQSSISPYLSDGFFWFLQRRCENSIIYHIFTLVQAIVFTTSFDSFFCDPFTTRICTYIPVLRRFRSRALAQLQKFVNVAYSPACVLVLNLYRFN